MDRRRWAQIEEIFQAAGERRPEERAAFVVEVCAGDEDLRREVESLLAQRSGETPLDRPAWELSAGARLGPYELLGPIGSGGMGTVFRARDTRLGRSVAIKVSTAEFSGRFANEARAVAALNHPHICTLHDVGPNYLVMEYLEGETLAERLRRGPLPAGEALRCGVEIAGAVAAAHEHGIIHRDLKPANIMLTEAGVKVLDFGLAKFTQPEAERQNPTASHAVIGTASYMSPEQAEGRPADARSDIFSLGAVLYEMVTGKNPFRRETELASLAAITRDEPEAVQQAAPGTPVELGRIIERCLRKDPGRRFQAANDLRIELEEMQEELGRGQQRGSRRWLPWAGAAAAAVALGVAIWVYWGSGRSPDAELRAEVLTGYPGYELSPSFSPDGTKVAFQWNGEKQDKYDIHVKQIGGSGTPVRLTSSASASFSPAWSPDDRWIAFTRSRMDGAEIFLIPPLGGPERKLIEIPGGLPGTGIAWTPDGNWLAYSASEAPDGPLSIWAIQVETGERHRLTRFERPGFRSEDPPGDFFPSFSPDGQHLAFVRQAKPFLFGYYRQRLSGDVRPAGEPVRMVEKSAASAWRGVWTGDSSEFVFSVGDIFTSRLFRVAAFGAQPPRVLPFALPAVSSLAISYNRPRLVYTWSLRTANLWRLDLGSKERKLLTSTNYDAGTPALSPDGRRIAVRSSRSGTPEVWACDAEGGNCQHLTHFNGPLCGSATWSPDGQWLALDSRPEGQSEIYVMPSDGGPLRRVTFSESEDVVPTWSRDGRWIYFASDRTGRKEIWKVAKEGGAPVQVTRNGGNFARESLDGSFVVVAERSSTSRPQASLYKVPVAGGQEEMLPIRPQSAFDFDLSARGIYFHSAPGSIQYFDYAGGKTTPVAEMGRRMSWMSVATDGSAMIMFEHASAVMDLMLVEGFR
jgi:Tol biopolymer transport system component